MYKVYIPFKAKIRSEKSWEISLSELKRAKADGIYLIYNRFLLDEQKMVTGATDFSKITIDSYSLQKDMNG